MNFPAVGWLPASGYVAPWEDLRRNLATEIAAGRVVVYPKGVWDQDDTLTLHVDGAPPTDSL